jgi:hypothetical protein
MLANRMQIARQTPPERSQPMCESPEPGNARLIVAARDMLAALQSVIAWYGEPPHAPARAIVKAREAIAKAMGATRERSAPKQSLDWALQHERIAISDNQTAIFTLPNGVKISIAIDDGGLFVHAGGDDATLRGGIHFVRNCNNEGWIEAKTLSGIRPAPLQERVR